MRRLAALALGLALWLHPVQPQAQDNAAATAAEAAALLALAGSALLEAEGARDRVEALTQTVRAYEQGLLALREGLRQAAVREQTILLSFEAERARLARLLAVLQSIEAAPAPLLLLHPDGPLGTVRSGMIVADVTPAVAEEALALRRQLEELAELRALQDGAQRQLTQALARVQEARTQLSQAIADRRMLPPNFTEDTAAMADLISSADSLDSLAELLATEPLATAASEMSFAGARGTLPSPVIGTLLRRAGEADAAGVTRPGILLATRPRALVTAPWPATVRYAGPLLDYGNVIILEPDASYLFVLAGMGALYVEAGELLSSGAPIGLMPGEIPNVDGPVTVETPQSATTALSETLYIEIREGGTPIDPTPWFAQDGSAFP